MTRGCPNCGSIRTIDAVDNLGEPYKGCPNCVVAATCFGCKAVLNGAVDECPRHPQRVTPRAKDPR